ncbi:MAG TPA: 50S ribosomal protein L18 [Steroidobacteraceae bacterium]|nr:50S ribosomal protein L18 [Steroidobacteraceae bacterium]
MEKNVARLRRAKATRLQIRKLGVPRLTVHRSDQHIYAQVISAEGDKVLAAASTVQKDLAKGLKGTKNKAAAAAVGKAIAQKAKAAGVDQVAFDRSGFRYHGRIAALADAAREAGLKF